MATATSTKSTQLSATAVSDTQRFARSSGGSGDPLIDDRIFAQQVRALHEAAPAALVANTAIAAGVALSLWGDSDRPNMMLWIWLVIALSAARLVTWMFYPKEGALKPSEARHWATLFVAGSAFSGLMWAGVSILLYPGGNLTYQLFLGAVLAGMTAGTLPALAYYAPVAYVYTLPAIVPYAIRALSQQSTGYYAIAVASVLFLTTLFLVARRMEHSTTARLRLQFENEALIERLTMARDAALASSREAAEANAAKAKLIDELERSRMAAEAASRAKSQFLAVMSHELRTPLNSIIGFSDIMRNEVFGPIGSPRYHEYAGDIHESGGHLLGLINNVLDLTKVEAGKFELFEEPVDIGDLAKSTLRLFRDQAKQTDIALDIRIDEGFPAVQADARAVKQMLINLVSNAVKFSRPGGCVAIAAALDGVGRPTICVSDQGIGIAPENIGRALTPFSQIDDPLTRRQPGTGLGLSLVKALIELHGGQLMIDSRVGAGTTVKLEFPVRRAILA